MENHAYAVVEGAAMTDEQKVVAVLRRFDSPGMRQDLSRWYNIPAGRVAQLAEGIEQRKSITEKPIGNVGA